MKKLWNLIAKIHEKLLRISFYICSGCNILRLDFFIFGDQFLSCFSLMTSNTLEILSLQSWINTNLILFLNWSFQNHHVCGTDFFLYLISKQVKVLASIVAEKEAVHYEGIFCSFFLIIFLARFSQMVLNIARLGKRKGSSYIHGQTSVDS